MFKFRSLAASLTLVSGTLTSSAVYAETMTNTAPAGDRHVGVGVAFEGGAGLSVFADTSSSNFVQGSAAWAASGAYQFTADYAFDYHGAFNSAPVLTPYWGIGALVLRDGSAFWPVHDETTPETHVGLRIPLGLSAVIPKTPVQISGELVPTLIASPSSYSYLEAGLSARVLF